MTLLPLSLNVTTVNAPPATHRILLWTTSDANEPCPDHCSQCTYESSTSSTQCTEGNCDTGYANNDADGTCGACGSNCLTCLTAGVGKCDSCETGYRVSSTKLCEKCSSFCTKCTSAGAGKCDSNSCDTGFTHNEDNECKACSSNCVKCSSNGPSKCDTNQCASEYAYADTTQTCIKCPNNCKSCTVADDGTTTECVDTQCYIGYGRKSTDKKCHECPNNCRTCEDANLDGVLHCTACSSRFILNNGVCGACPINCQSCMWVSEFGLECTACKEEFTFDTDKNCLACPNYCSQCTYDSSASTSMCMEGKCDEGYARDSAGQCIKCSSLAFDACALCTDISISGDNSTSASTTTSTCMECNAGYTLADDNLSCKTCSISSTANCGTCYDRPGHYCTQCDGESLLSESKEICGVSCYQCSGDNCDTFSANNMDSEVCEECWVVQETLGTVVNTMRGCFNSTCTTAFQTEMCEDVDGFTQCKRCCTGTNCNSFDLTGSASVLSSAVSAFIMMFALHLLY